MKIPDGLTCKNTFFDIPAVDQPESLDLGPATCPLPTEGWWSSPSQSRASPNPLEEIGPTPDWFTTPAPQPPPSAVGSASAPGTGASANAPTPMSRFDRLLMEATADGSDGDGEHEDEAQDLPPSVGLPSGLAFGGSGGLDTPWEDGPHFAPLRPGPSVSIPPPRGLEPPPTAPPPAPPPAAPSAPARSAAAATTSRFDTLLMEATNDDAQASRRSSVNSNVSNVGAIPETPWDCGAGGLETPWEDAPHYAAAHGFPASTLPPPLLAPGGPVAPGPGLGGLPSVGDSLAAAASRHLPPDEFSLGYNFGEPARLPLVGEGAPLPATGPLLSVPPPDSAPPPIGPPAGGRVIVDLARELGFMPNMATGALLPPYLPEAGAVVPAAKARRRRGSKEAKQPDRDKDSAWWLPTCTFIDLGNLVKAPKLPASAPAATTPIAC